MYVHNDYLRGKTYWNSSASVFV